MFEETIRDFFIDMAQKMRENGYPILNNLKTKFGNYPSVVDNVIFESDNEESDDEQ